jgi:hypothetical protein
MDKRKQKLNCGDHLIVKQGVLEPDFKSVISGWTGKINDIDSTSGPNRLVEIYWDKATLTDMSKKHIKKCDKKNLNHEIMWLEEDEIELTKL